MRQIPQKLRNRIDQDPFYRRCLRSREGTCSGRITIEHAIIVAGKQLNELWCLLPLCWHHHLGAGLDKRLNHLLAYLRASDDDLAKYPKSRPAWEQERDFLKPLYPDYENVSFL